MADTATLKLAALLVRQYEADFQDYLDDCEADRSRGHRPHYCEHGTNLWTDYDNICGGCEDGRTMSDPFQRHVRALYEAKKRRARALELADFLVSAHRLGLHFKLDLSPVQAEMRELMMI